MANKTIYLIRHGETDYNLKGIVQGSGVDASLNATGQKQAKAFYEHYKHLPFDKIYTSALRRSIESVEGFLKDGIAHEQHAGLNEISWGNKDGQIISGDDHLDYMEMLACWSRGDVEKCIDGGESPLDVQKRQKPVLDHIISQIDEELILICMHGRAMRILLSSILDLDLKNMDKYQHHNLCLYILKHNGLSFSLEKYNDLEHLKFFSVQS